MSDSPQPTTKTPASRSKHWQVSLRTLFLLMAVIAVWLTYFINRQRNDWLESQVAAVRPLVRELVIDDEGRIAVVKLEELWYDENQWDIYLPEGRYRLCLATQHIDQQGFAPLVKSLEIGSGRHQVALEQKQTEAGWRVIVTTNRAGQLIVEEPEEWDPGHGSSGGGQFSQSEQKNPDEPLVLFRRIFSKPDVQGQMTISRTPDEPAEGILLWIERVADSI